VILHSLFDFLALLTAVLVFRYLPVPGDGGAAAQPWQRHPLYLTAASLGVTLGAYLFGTLNLWLSGIEGFGRSIEGAIAGGVISIELLKAATGMRGSTGLRFAAPLAAAIVVGRIGCFLAGIDDQTYGSATDLPWAVDFGDGIPRHPVQLYESLSMAVFLAGFILLLGRRHPLALRTGFYLFVGAYAGQRFLWEFLKPYGAVFGPFNCFHLLSAALIAYAIIFARQEFKRAWTTQTSPASMPV